MCRGVGAEIYWAGGWRRVAVLGWPVDRVLMAPWLAGKGREEGKEKGIKGRREGRVRAVKLKVQV